MSLTPHEQFVEALKRSRSVAVLFRAAWNGDALGSALAVARFIESYGKPVEIICDGFVPHPHFGFLPAVGRVQPSLREARRLILSFDLDKTKFSHLAYEVKDNRLHIMLTPKDGTFDPKAMQTVPDAWKHDLIVTVGAPDIAALGGIGRDHKEFFHATPVVNIDHDPSNERYGTINFVDMRASSTAEVTSALLEAIDAKRMDAETATCLLTGLISATKSFRTPNVTPATLALAGRLVELGGRRAEIVERLFRTRPVEALRLWGRVLARLKVDKEHRIVWSLLARTDFVHAGADETHLADVIDELITTSPEAEVVCILHEHPREENKVCAIVSAERAKNAMQLTELWSPQGHHRLAKIAVKDIALPAFERQLIDHIRSQIAVH